MNSILLLSIVTNKKDFYLGLPPPATLSNDEQLNKLSIKKEFPLLKSAILHFAFFCYSTWTNYWKVEKNSRALMPGYGFPVFFFSVKQIVVWNEMKLGEPTKEKKKSKNKVLIIICISQRPLLSSCSANQHSTVKCQQIYSFSLLCWKFVLNILLSFLWCVGCETYVCFSSLFWNRRVILYWTAEWHIWPNARL